MEYKEKIEIIKKLVNDKDFNNAKNMLNDLIESSSTKIIEDDNNTHYSFNNYIEILLFWNKYRPNKTNIVPDINYSDIYYYLGYISIEVENNDEAIEYLEKGLKWNPMDVLLMFELAHAYRKTGNIEKYKAQIEKTHLYIYNSIYMARYYRELGWYYVEKGVFDLANALYTRSLAYCDIELAKNELVYIAKKENRNARFSTNDEIKKLFSEYNIKDGFDSNVVNSIYEEYKRLSDVKPQPQVLSFISRTMYDITLDKNFMTYCLLKDNKYGIEIIVPDLWKCLNKNYYKKFNVDENVVFFLIQPNNVAFQVEYIDKCNEEQLKGVFRCIVDNMKSNGQKVEKEYFLDDKVKSGQIFVKFKQDDNMIRKFKIYRSINGYLFCITWKVTNENVDLDELLKNINNTFCMQAANSLDKINLKTNSNKIEKIVETESKENLKVYMHEIPNFPTFKFYFPESLGKYIKTSSNVFELKDEKNIQKIRVMISKCSKVENLESDAKKWIEKNKVDAKMDDVSYRKEVINNIPIEVYELKFINKSNKVNKIYKIGYVNGYRITISGGLVKGKEEIINKAFEKMTWIDNETTIK